MSDASNEGRTHPEDRSDALVLTLCYPDRKAKRLLIEPGSEDPRASHTLVDERLSLSGEFRQIGAEPLSGVTIENAGAWGEYPETIATIREHLEQVTPEGADDSFHLRSALQLLDVLEHR